MKKTYFRIEEHFETLASSATKVIGNSITFSLALIVVIFWIFKRDFLTLNMHDFIGDIISSITFLSLFLLQKALNKFISSMHT